MVDLVEDLYAFIVDDCTYSSSQEDLLRSNFARDFAGEFTGISSPISEFSGGDIEELLGGTGSGPNGGGGNENENNFGDLGFRGDRMESPKPKRRVSPLMHCSGKVAIEGEIDSSELVFKGDVRVKLVRPLRCVGPDGVECGAKRLRFEGDGNGAVSGEKLGSEGDGEGAVSGEKSGCEGCEEGAVENRGKKKLKIGGGTEEIDVEDDVVKNDENIYTEVIEVGEEEENGKNEEGANLDTAVIGVDEEVGDRAKVDDTCDVDERMTEFEKAGEMLEKGGGTMESEVIANVDSKVVGVDEGLGHCAKVDGETSNVDLVKDVVEERGNCAKVDGETCNVDMEEILVEEERGNCAAVDGETRNADMEETVVEEEQCNFGDMNDSKKEIEDGIFKLDKGDGDENEKPNEDVSRGEETRMREEEKRRKKRKLPRSMFGQWGEGLRNKQGCSKNASLEGIRTKNENDKPMDGEASIRSILDKLKSLVEEKMYGGIEVDFFETAKRRGMTFPQPRFRLSMEEDL